MQTPLYLQYNGNRDAVVEGAVNALKDFGRKYLFGREFTEAPWPRELPYSSDFVGGDPAVVKLLHYQNSEPRHVKKPSLKEYFERTGNEDVFGLDLTNTVLETDFSLPLTTLLTQRKQFSGRGNVLHPAKAVLVMTRHGFQPEKSDAYNEARAYVLAYRGVADLPLDRVRPCQDEVCVLRTFGEDFDSSLDETVTRFMFEKKVRVCEKDEQALRYFVQRWDVTL